MSKVLKVAAVVVGVAALAVATAGIGAGAALASVSTLGVTSTMAAGASLFGLSAATLSTIAGGLSLASSLTAKRPSLGSTGTQTQFKADPNAPIPYAIGRTFVAGNIVHQASSGTNNELLHFAIIWSGGGPIDSFEAFKVDGATVTFGAGGAAIGAYAGFMWLKTQLGAAPEAAALSPGSGSMPGWGASSKLSGYAAGLWTLKYDKKGKVFTAGVPKAGMVAKWTRVYDPRKDSTYPGGSGAHRPLVETTYEWSDSPWLNALTWAMGRLQNGQFVLGARQKFDSIDVAAFVEAANVAQANGWKAGGLVTSADDPWQVLKALCQAGGGEPIRIGAMLSCIVNTPRVSLGTITALDLAGPASVTATQARRDRINGVIGKYRSEDHDWEMVDAAPVRIDAYVTFDGRRRTRPITYPLVQCFAGQQPVQVAQLAAYDIYNAREIPAIVTPLKIRFVGVKPGDCWTLDIPEAGLNNQLCMLRQRSLDVAKGVPTLTWRSETTGKHDAALGKTTTPPPTPTLGLIDLSNVPAPAVGAWTATGTALTANGVSVPAIVISGAVENPAAEAVVIEYRPTGSPAWINASTEDANLVKFELDRVTSGTDYDIAISYRVRNVVGARRVLGPVTTGDWEGISGAGAFTMVAGANVKVTPNSITKVGGSTWDAGAYSLEGYLGDVEVSAQINDVTKAFMIGLNADPSADDSYTGLDFAIYCYTAGIGGTNTWQAAVSNTYPASGGALANGDTIRVRRRGTTVEFSINGAAPFYVKAGVNPGVKLYMDCTLHGLGAKIENITFNPVGADGAPGLDGTDGLPGTPGADGQTSYVHFAYANNATGTLDFTTGAPGGRYYVGVYTDFTAADSTNPASYTWSLQRGADGANGTPGAPGADGSATYVHIAYATAADGSTGFSTTDGTGKTYIGTYTDGALADSANPALYTWSLIKGDTGAPGLTISPASGITVACYSNGNPKSGELPKGFSVKVYAGGADVTSSCTFAPTNTGCGVTSDGAGNFSLTSITADQAQSSIVITYGSVSATQVWKFTKSKDGSSATSAAQTVSTLPSSTSYAVAASVDLAVNAGVAINGNFAVSYKPANVVTSPGSYELAGYLTLQNITDGGTESTVAGPVTGSLAQNFPSDVSYNEGFLSLSGGGTNPAGTVKVFRLRLYLKKNSGIGNGTIVSGPAQLQMQGG